MLTKEWRTVDKSGWDPGPWMREPDKVQWTDPETGLPCLIVRNNVGALCGYAGVSESHPFYRLHYGDCPKNCERWVACEHTAEMTLKVHGGVTFSGGCQQGGDESRGICHTPDPGEPDHVWWFGFDCSHSDDQFPGYDSIFDDGIYRTIDYVRHEVQSLARQLPAMMPVSA